MILNEVQFAEWIGVSPKTVSNLISQGLPAVGGKTRGAHWRIDTAPAMLWLIDYEANRRVANPEVDDITGARLNKLIEEHRKLKIDNDAEELRLLDADQVRQVFMAALSEFDALLRGAAESMAGGDTSLEQKLLDEHGRIRNTLARRLAAFDPLPRPACPD